MGWDPAEMTGSSSVMEIGVLWYRHLLSEYPRSSIYPWKIKDCFIMGWDVWLVNLGYIWWLLQIIVFSWDPVPIYSLSSVIVDVHYNNILFYKKKTNFVHKQSLVFNSFLICFNSLWALYWANHLPKSTYFKF